MNNPQKQTVYLPTKVEDAEKYSKHTIECEECEGLTDDEQYTCSHCWCEGGDGELGFDDIFAKKEGYFFTPEQLNEYTANVIKQTLETAAEKAEVSYEMNGLFLKTSITNTFENTFEKFKV